ncbi:hypothetical protein EVAR_49078_1 [Eumeta japonica]|uniref:Uncharacterized protein n=1 Tax=Eumeta variegata TaxID=151549 RepID=A0A4C2AE54_EUMVA|nr:hypothetical protein EVAR_49078_1 [Eumeta japonica]
MVELSDGCLDVNPLSRCCKAGPRKKKSTYKKRKELDSNKYLDILSGRNEIMKEIGKKDRKGEVGLNHRNSLTERNPTAKTFTSRPYSMRM